jgi:RNA polymerase sigma factor (sigma-70 family)
VAVGPEPGDAALVAAARAGDRAALGTLLARHRPLALALCRRAIGDAGLAEDAAQEACLQAMLSLERLRKPERFGSWLAGIALNVCRRWLRARNRNAWSWEAVAGGLRLPEPVDPGPGPEAAAERADEAAAVWRSIATLPPGQRDAVVLYYLRGLSSLEVASALGIEPGSVKTRLYKARHGLRRRMGAESDMTTAHPEAVEVMIADVRRLAAPYDDDRPARHWIVLQEQTGERRMAIWMGETEAESIAWELERLKPPRPMTYEFAAALLQATGARVVEIRVDRLEQDTFFATVVLEGASGRHEFDARPSDALNLAVRTDAPIRVASDVFERSAVSGDATAALSSEMATELRGRIRAAEGVAEIVAPMRERWQRKA